jgi:hypothetical protein
MMKPQKTTIGTTHHFVLSQGFTQIGSHAALLGEDGTKRLFVELFADPDRPAVRPQEAYKSILSSMQPGWTLRLLQTFWPDPEPRLAFQRQAQDWQKPASDGLDLLYQGLLLSTEQFPLPFARRTIVEFVFPGNEGLAWWEGLSGLCQGFGIKISYLTAQEIQSILGWMFNPKFD